MTKTLHGKVNGKTIEFDEDLGVPMGQEVEVQVRVIPIPYREPVRLSSNGGGIGPRYRMGRDHGRNPPGPEIGTPAWDRRPGLPPSGH